MNEYETLSEQTVHSGLRFDLNQVVERGPNGRECTREVIRHPGAAVILPVLDDGQVVLVRQHRTAAGETLLEVPAGVIDAGEEPLVTAHRELQEETGYRAQSMQHLVTFYPAPGMTDERMHVYLATGLEAGPSSPDPDEHLEVVVAPLDTVRDYMLTGAIVDGKTMLAIMYVMLVGMSSDGAVE